ncbi:hypothetical protein C2G38_2151922 [Gigaspora rosea]|uniref:Uncharacterized protein n=1 Tax=Gigaspora rosea TaxID=44941 RepID=A0A397W932_9GLOM|nr:hypothetical protein C2G38_2151922 [Gigaspora rosea]
MRLYRELLLWKLFYSEPTNNMDTELVTSETSEITKLEQIDEQNLQISVGASYLT